MSGETLTGDPYPRRTYVQEEEYLMVSRCYGIWREFSVLEHQPGDYRGSLALYDLAKIPCGFKLVIPQGIPLIDFLSRLSRGGKFSIGNRFSPINLTDYEDCIYQLGRVIEDKRHRKPNFDLLQRLGHTTLKPYHRLNPFLIFEP